MDDWADVLEEPLTACCSKWTYAWGCVFQMGCLAMLACRLHSLLLKHVGGIFGKTHLCYIREAV